MVPSKARAQARGKARDQAMGKVRAKGKSVLRTGPRVTSWGKRVQVRIVDFCHDSPPIHIYKYRLGLGSVNQRLRGNTPLCTGLNSTADSFTSLLCRKTVYCPMPAFLQLKVSSPTQTELYVLFY